MVEVRSTEGEGEGEGEGDRDARCAFAPIVRWRVSAEDSVRRASLSPGAPKRAVLSRAAGEVLLLMCPPSVGTT